MTSVDPEGMGHLWVLQAAVRCRIDPLTSPQIAVTKYPPGHPAAVLVHKCEAGAVPKVWGSATLDALLREQACRCRTGHSCPGGECSGQQAGWAYLQGFKLAVVGKGMHL